MQTMNELLIYHPHVAGLLIVVAIFVVLYQIKTQNKKIMATQEQLNQAIEALNAATNEIASDLQKLRDQIAAGTITDESMATLNENIARLQGLGAEDGETDTDEQDGE